MTPPLREGLFDPLAEFWIFDGFLEFFFWKLDLPKKISSAPAGQIFFSEITKSCNFNVKIGDFLKFATPPENIFMTSPNRIFYDPLYSNTKELAHLWYVNGKQLQIKDTVKCHTVIYFLDYNKNIRYYVLPHRQIKYPVDFDDELKTRKRQIR